MGFKKASAYFLKVEKQALEDGLSVDYEVIAATGNYSAVTCIVSEKEGTRRIVRMASDRDISTAQECAGYMALCAYYGKDIEEAEKDSIPGSSSAEAGTPNASSARTESLSGKQAEPRGNSAQGQKKQQMDAQQKGSVFNGRAADDFRVPIANYKNREDNWISDMVKTKEGRKVISMLCNVTNPKDTVKGMVDAAKAYVERHRINLKE